MDALKSAEILAAFRASGSFHRYESEWGASPLPESARRAMLEALSNPLAKTRWVSFREQDQDLVLSPGVGGDT